MSDVNLTVYRKHMDSTSIWNVNIFETMDTLNKLFWYWGGVYVIYTYLSGGYFRGRRRLVYIRAKERYHLAFLSLRPCVEIQTFGTLLLILFNVLQICKYFQFYCKWIINYASWVLKTQIQNQKSHKRKQPKNTLVIQYWSTLQAKMPNFSMHLFLINAR